MKPIRKPVSTFPKQSPNHPLLQKSSSEKKSKFLVQFRTDNFITKSDVKKFNAASSTTPSDNVVGPSTVLQEEDNIDHNDIISSSLKKEDKWVMCSSENKKNVRIKKPRFAISLTKGEIDLDFLQLTGVKPKRKPRKRDNNVQANLVNTFPGHNTINSSAATLAKFNILQSHAAKTRDVMELGMLCESVSDKIIKDGKNDRVEVLYNIADNDQDRTLILTNLTGNVTDVEGSSLKGINNDVVPSMGKEKRSSQKEIKKPSFTVSLTKDEIELDILQLTGLKPKRKRQKRDDDVQKKLDSTFPGLKL
ncbi:unnamed protein product [Dovyalis caffra]|uniref:Uncharacterized protein n=1 Tax=Dovyalis caffra TaxID=77055 RepID=A0AAV1S9X6_9ROSI|nr:unnamed protein product [Dovyalis caffra]